MPPARVRPLAAVALAASLVAFPSVAWSVPPTAAQQVTPPGASTPTPTHDMSDMEGMDHGEPEAEPDESTGGHSEHGESDGGHTDATPPSTTRPRAAVLSGFAGLNAAVLVTAAVLRRRDRDRPRHRPRPAATPTAA